MFWNWHPKLHTVLMLLVLLCADPMRGLPTPTSDLRRVLIFSPPLVLKVKSAPIPIPIPIPMAGVAQAQALKLWTNQLRPSSHSRLAAPCRLGPPQVPFRRCHRTRPGTEPHAQPHRYRRSFLVSITLFLV